MKDKILKALNWRYAVKKFQKDKKVPKEDVDALLDVLQLSPSSAGIQPWRFVIVSDPAVREKLKAAAYGQPQITDASELIVFCYRTDLDDTFLHSVVDATAKARNQTREDLKGYNDMIHGTVAAKGSPEKLAAWAARQPYIALGMLLEAAALMEIDACPMEGFNPEQFDEILGLDKGTHSVAVCTLGYRSPDDMTAKAAKARLSKEDIFIRI